MKNNMLIIDDIEIDRAILAELFKHDFEIYECMNALQAVETLQSHETHFFDIILLDLFMPIMNGFEFITDLHQKNNWNTPIIVISSCNDIENQKYVFLNGATDFILKPFNPDSTYKRIMDINRTVQNLKKYQKQDTIMNWKSFFLHENELFTKIEEKVKINTSNTLFLISIDQPEFNEEDIQKILKIIFAHFSNDIIGFYQNNYLVLSNHLMTIEDIENVANSLLDPFQFYPNITYPANITLSIGISSNQETSLGKLLEEATSALQKSKEQGRNQYNIFNVNSSSFYKADQRKLILISRNRELNELIESLCIDKDDYQFYTSIGQINQNDIENDNCHIFIDLTNNDDYFSSISKLMIPTNNHVVAFCDAENPLQKADCMMLGINNIILFTTNRTALETQIIEVLNEEGPNEK